MISMWRWTLTVALAWLALATLHAPQAQANCKEFMGAERADIKGPKVREVVRVWQRVHGPFEALSGRTTALAVLSKEASHAGEDGAPVAPFKPTAHICPGAPPTVFVTWPMVELVFDEGAARGYPEAFLAFVLGHELGHRVNDLDTEGSLLGSSDRASQGTGYGIEEMADKRAAFLAATAGYSMRGLAKEEVVATFLTTEIGLRSWRVENRQMMLMGTLRTFDAYEHLYELGVAMTMSGERELALRLLARADELIAGESVPLPEIKALRAIALMNAAAAHAPWRDPIAALPTPELRCAPVFPTHTALWEEPSAGALRGGPDLEGAQELARARLALAARLLDQAEPLGVAPLILHSARPACPSTRPSPAKREPTSSGPAPPPARRPPRRCDRRWRTTRRCASSWRT